jgi:hypothetical protein
MLPGFAEEGLWHLIFDIIAAEHGHEVLFPEIKLLV